MRVSKSLVLGILILVLCINNIVIAQEDKIDELIKQLHIVKSGNKRKMN